MKTFFIVESSDTGHVSGKISHDLVKDFIKPCGITYEEEYDDEDKFGMDSPIITDLSIEKDSGEIYIFEMDSTKDYQNLIGQFNFYRDPVDDVLDFLNDYFLCIY